MMPKEAPGDWKGGSTDQPGPKLTRQVTTAPTEADFRFTAGAKALYVFGYQRPQQQARIASLAIGKAKVERVTLLDLELPLTFVQTPEALVVTLTVGATVAPMQMPYCLRIEGSVPLGNMDAN
jgi:hypothetical protein